jgi:hypothetical protein
MQLVIKLYNDKPSRIGIIYPTEFQAGKAYEAIIDRNKGEKFRATIELLAGHAMLTLISINGSAKIVYKGLEFKVDQLKKLQAYIKPNSPIHFVHTYWKGSTMYLAKVRFRNPEPVFIEEYEII